MNFRKMLADLHPELKEKYASEQYVLAQKIIGKKLSLKVSQPVLASLMGVSYDKYLDMESGSIHVPVVDYQLALIKVEGLTRTEIDPEFIDVISKFSSFVMKQSKDSIEENILFNVKDNSLDELNWRLKHNEITQIILKAQTDLVKDLKSWSLNLNVEPGLDEEELLVSKMVNNLNKGIQETAKYSFELKEEFISGIPISA